MNKASPERFALIGLSGSGKTEVGERVSRVLGWTFLDSDRLVEAEAGRTVRAIFEAEGEAGFREREARVLARIAAETPPLVASLGGGVVLRSENRNLLKQCFYVIWVQVDPQDAWKRLAGSGDRPLLAGEDPRAALQAQDRERRPLYAAAAQVRVRSPRGSSVESVSREMLRILESPPRSR